MSGPAWNGATMRQAWKLGNGEWVKRNPKGRWLRSCLPPQDVSDNVWCLPAGATDTWHVESSAREGASEIAELIQSYIDGTVRPPDWYDKWVPNVGDVVWVCSPLRPYWTHRKADMLDIPGYHFGHNSEICTRQPWPPSPGQLAARGQSWNTSWGPSPYEVQTAEPPPKSRPKCFHGEVIGNVPWEVTGYSQTADYRQHIGRVKASTVWHRNYGKYARGLPHCPYAQNYGHLGVGSLAQKAKTDIVVQCLEACNCKNVSK